MDALVDKGLHRSVRRWVNNLGVRKGCMGA